MRPDFAFYQEVYLGELIPEKQFIPCIVRASVWLQHFERVFTVTGGQEERKLAMCAMAEAIYRDRCRGGAVRQTVGSVTVAYGSDTRWYRELYAAASIYLTICRGVA